MLSPDGVAAAVEKVENTLNRVDAILVQVPASGIRPDRNDWRDGVDIEYLVRVIVGAYLEGVENG